MRKVILNLKKIVLADINQCIKINKQKKPVDIVQFSIW